MIIYIILYLFNLIIFNTRVEFVEERVLIRQGSCYYCHMREARRSYKHVAVVEK